MSSVKTYALFILIVLVIVISSGIVNAQSVNDETDPELEARMEWWSDARFGMFLHWGVYSVFGGEWDGVDHGKEMGEASAEWIYLRADIPRKEYEKAAGRFNPLKYDPVEWVRIAKDAGMKYMVLTSKHHDGFAMFDTEASEWDIMQSSPYKKDIIRMYTDACHENDMRVGLYFSHEKDWFHHQKINRDTSKLSEEYIRITKTHLKELLTNYGQIDVIWFDMGIGQHAEFNQMLYQMVRTLQPNCIISSRIGNGLGDYRNLGDRQLAPPGMKGYVESIMTLRLNWGYDRNDNNWKSSDEVISMLSKCACRNSNFLLNMGPQPDGRFTTEEVTTLKKVGEWMRLSNEAIYHTTGSPFKGEYPWGSLSAGENKVYLHLFNWHGGSIHANGITSGVKRAYILQSGREVKLEQQTDLAQLTVFVPDHAYEQLLPIVVLELDSDLEVDTARGPTWIPETIHHKNRLAISGVAESVIGTDFSIGSGEEEHRFGLNENIRYRINNRGNIVEVQGFHLEVGEKYKVIYAAHEIPVVKIITLIK